MVVSNAKIMWTIVWAIIVFIISAVIEAMITVFLFKKFGGCPMQKK